MTHAAKKKGKTQTQPKLTDFGAQSMEQRVSKEANANAANANANTGAPEQSGGELTGAKEEILTAINGLKSEFSTRLDGILTAIEETRKDLSDCTERMTQAETRLSTVEDEQAGLQDTVQKLERRNKVLEDKVVDMETRSRLNNLRLVNLPEGAEGSDACSFLENWIPEVLDMGPQRSPIVMERAHRVGPRRDADASPRTLIMKFLNYKQKMLVIKAAKAKKDILYKNQQVRFYNDLATEVHRQRKQYDSVRQQLRSLGLRHGIIPPAKLVVTYKERTHTFNTPSEAQDFIKRVKEEAG